MELWVVQRVVEASLLLLCQASVMPGILSLLSIDVIIKA